MIVDDSGITYNAIRQLEKVKDTFPEDIAVILSAIPLKIILPSEQLIPGKIGDPWFFVVSPNEILFASNGLSWGYRGEGPHGSLKALNMLFNIDANESLFKYKFLIIGKQKAIKYALKIIPEGMRHLFMILYV